MKKRLIALCLLLCALALGAAAQSIKPAISFDMDSPSSLPFKRYDNLVYHYGFSIPGELQAGEPYNDFSQKERVYEGREWSSPDQGYVFFFQLKTPTFKSLDEEIERLPQYLDLMRPSTEAAGGRNLRFVHEDPALIHEFPAGRMLENATQFEFTDEDGAEATSTTVYYDYYDGTNEYIFGISSSVRGYEEIASLLQRVGESITLKPIRILIDSF